MRIVHIVIALLAASPAFAQDPVFESEITEQCQAENPHPDVCIGASAASCIESAGGVTAVQGYCYAEELGYWDDMLNHQYQLLRETAQRRDVELSEKGFGQPIAEEGLRNMQQTWIAYRDARCGFVGAIYSAGTGAGPAGTECLMRETAEQTLLLSSLREAF